MFVRSLLVRLHQHVVIVAKLFPNGTIDLNWTQIVDQDVFSEDTIYIADMDSTQSGGLLILGSLVEDYPELGLVWFESDNSVDEFSYRVVFVSKFEWNGTACR